MPDAQLAALKSFLRLPAVSPWSDDDLTFELVAERKSQARKCRVPAADVPEDLTKALFRRVARALALRGLPLGLQSSMSDVAVSVTRIGDDVEIRRLEAPYRKLTFG